MSGPRIAIVGVGLIGGSLAIAARERLGATVTGWDADPEVLAAGLRRGVIDRATGSVADAVQGAQAAFAAVPVGGLAATVAEILAHAPPDCVVSDVGSTKRALVDAQDDPRFVGGHPLAGAETSGVEHARGDLFEGAVWYLTPSERASGVLYERLHRLLHGLGARPCAIDASVHDRFLAAVSHLPHVIANVLVGLAASIPGDGHEMLPATGPSFRDATRVAGAPSDVWTDIYLANADALIGEIDRAVQALGEVRRELAAGDATAIRAWNEAAAQARRRLHAGGAAGEGLIELRAAVPNRPGVIAQLALRLGRSGVNIADLALYPAADMSEGVVALWVAGEADAERALAEVAALGFPVARA